MQNYSLKIAYVRMSSLNAREIFQRHAGKWRWQILFTSQWRDEMYLTLVAADTGEILYRRNLTAESQEATYRVYTNASPAPLLPGLSAPGTDQAAPVARTLITLASLDPFASPDGWINDGDNETRGNNVDAHLDRNDDDLADLPRPTGNPSRVFDFPLDLTAAPANYGQAATVQLFYWDNWMHDALYQFGFTEAAGNFQTDNFGRGGLGNDALQADAQDGLGLNDGSHANNANMSTPPDGCAPRMQMYVFDGASPARDGSLDAQIVLHEYTHGLSTRLVGGGAGIDAIQSAGMGEGWSDFYALALLTDPAADVDGVYPMGAYVTYHGFGSQFDQNYYYGIRRYPYCTDTNKNPLVFADIDPATASAHDGVPRNPLLGPFRADQAGEVHSQGEVWCMMLWEMRANLIRKLGPEAGNNLALQLVTDGLKLSPPNPNFVQARDAILLADRMWSGGTNAAEIWSAFAKRGLGFNAKAPESYTTSGAQESHDLMPALAAERVEIQNGSGSVELGVNNNLLIHLRNQGDATATHVSGQLATAVPGVTVLQGVSTYSDIPQGGSGANAAVFQIQTGTGFVEGTPIDMSFAISSDQSAGTNYLRLFTGVPGAEILFDNYSAMADPISASSGPKDLTPWYIGNAEPLWMADDASCLLKAGEGKYILWKPGGTNQIINNDKFKFLAHRLTRHGVVVGTVEDTVTRDEAMNQIRHTWGVWWDFNSGTPQPLTTNEYRWPKNAAPLDIAGAVFSLLNTPFGQPVFLTNVTTYPTLQDVWDLNAGDQAVGSVSVQEQFMPEQVTFASNGQMNWFTASERGLDVGVGTNSATQVNYPALFTTAAQFYSIESWRWLGPLSQYKSGVVAQLINDAGMIAGYGGVFTGDPILDSCRPSHAFRALSTAEYDGSMLLLTDIGVLPGGAQSMPRAMNQAGELVGFSDFDVTNTGGLNFSSANSHAVFWGLTNESPEWLTNYPASSKAPHGYGDAFALNDSHQIVGASMTANSQPVGVLWQINHNTNGVSSTTNAPFWEITDLNDRLTDPSLYVFNAVGINNDGLILAYAQNAAGENHAVLLATPQLAVDANRDGTITFDDADQTSAAKPYRFWLNDDQDESQPSDTFTEDDPEIYEYQPKHHDSDDRIINSPRDCEDLTRLWLDTGNLANYLTNGATDLYLGLKWRNTGGTKPSVRLFRSVDATGGLGHIKNAKTAALQASGFPDSVDSPNYCLLDVTAPDFAPIPSDAIDQVQPTDRPADFIFKKSVFNDPNDVFGPKLKRIFLLFEGVTEGKGELRLVLLQKNLNGSWKSLSDGPGVWLDLKNIRRMYVRAYSTPLPENFPLPWQAAACKNPPDFPYLLNWMTGSLYIPLENLGYGIGDSVETVPLEYPFDAPPDEQNKCVVFVHGIDLSVAEQQGYAQSFYKRLWWEGYRGRLVAFRWCTPLDKGMFSIGQERENTSFYNSGEYRSFNDGTSLLKYVDQLRTDLGNDWIISVAAHSLGNACTGEALHQGMQVNSYVAMEAAVSLSCYYTESENPPTVPSLVRADDASPTPCYAHELGYQGYLSDIRDSAVNRASYYNADDFWLVRGHTKTTKGRISVNWIDNHIKYKPDNRYGFGEYKYESQSGLPRQASFERGRNYTRSVSDPFEGMAYVARSRTRPLGAGGPPPNFQGLDLQTVYKFDQERSCHSGQFQRNIQLMYGDQDGNNWVDKNGNPNPFYDQLMRDLNVGP